MSVEGGRSVGLAARGGGLSAAPRFSAMPRGGGGERSITISVKGSVGSTRLPDFERSLRMTSLDRPSSAAPGPRLTLGGENRSDQKFTVRTFSGPRPDTDSSQRSPKVGNIPQYRRVAPRTLGAYQEFGSRRPQGPEQSAPTQRTASESTGAPSPSRFAPVGYGALAAEASRISMNALRTDQQAQSSVIPEARPSTPNAAENVLVERAFPNTRNFVPTETVTQQVFDGGRSRYTTADRLQSSTKYVPGANRSENFTQAQLDNVRITDARPINPTHLAPEVQLTATAVPELAAMKAIAEKQAAVRRELETITVQQQAQARKSTSPVERLDDPEISPREVEKIVHGLRGTQPELSGARYNGLLRRRVLDVIKTRRTVVDRKVPRSDGANGKSDESTSHTPILKPIYSYNPQSGHWDSVTMVAIQHPENDWPEVRKAIRFIGKMQEKTGVVPGFIGSALTDMLERKNRARTEAQRIIGTGTLMQPDTNAPQPDTESDQQVEISTRPDALLKTRVITVTHNSIVQQNQEVVSPGAASKFSGKEQAALQPASIVSSAVGSETNQSMRTKVKNSLKNTALQLKLALADKDESILFKFFKPAQDKRVKQWEDAVSRTFPHFDAEQRMPMQQVAQQLDAPSPETASPIANAVGKLDGGDLKWRNDVMHNDAEVTRREALDEGRATIESIRPVYVNESGPDVEEKDLRLVFSDEKEIESQKDLGLAA